MPQTKSDAEIILDAEREIAHLMECHHADVNKIILCERKLKAISRNGAGLSQSIPALVESIDEALVRQYPHEGYWDHSHRATLIGVYTKIIDNIVAGDPVERTELQKVVKFCKTVRIGFEHHQKTRSHDK